MTARPASLLIRSILLVTLIASTTVAAPAAAAPRAQVGAFLPLFSFFGAIAARNRVYRTAEEFIDDSNAHYDKLVATARQQYINRDLATIGPSQLAAYTKVVVAIERERRGVLAVAEQLKKQARGEFQQRLQNVITTALLGTGPAQRLVGALRNGVNSSKNFVEAALKQLAGESGGVLADVAKVKRIAAQINAVAGNIGGPTGRSLREISGRISRITGNLDRIESELQEVQADLEELDGNVAEVEQVQQVLSGSVTGREAGIYVLTGETDNPVLESIVGILRRKSTDASGLRDTARERILQGVVVRCVTKAAPLLDAIAALEDGSAADIDALIAACQTLEGAAAADAAAAARAALTATAAVQAVTQTAVAATATESARQTEAAAPPAIINFADDWHSKEECDEIEPDAAYRWSISLKQDAAGHITGRITFHKCPGGGRVQYEVSGQATASNTVTLTGRRTGGRGGIGGSPGTQDFIITPSGPPDPNFAP